MKIKRKGRKQVDAILVSDLHLTDITPIARTDDYRQAQEKKLAFLENLSRQHQCPILCAGDIFDYWKVPPALLLWSFRHIPGMITIPGNHDLPMHSITQYDKSPLSLLEEIEHITVLHPDNPSVSFDDFGVTGIAFGQDIPQGTKPKREGGKKQVLLLHALVWEDSPPFWASQSSTARDVIKKYGEFFDLIVTGDNHANFVVQEGDTLLVNPGSMMRRTAAQLKYQPLCFLWYREQNQVVSVPFPIDSGVISDEHLVSQKERDNRLAAYIARMGMAWEQGISFRQRLGLFFQENKTPTKIQDIIWRHLEGADSK